MLANKTKQIPDTVESSSDLDHGSDFDPISVAIIWEEMRPC